MNRRYTFFRYLALGALVLALSASSARAQTETQAPAPSKKNYNYADDVASVDAIITAIYDVISGPANHPRDWNRFRALLTPTCQFIPINRNEDGTHAHVALTADQFIQNAGAYFDQNSFYEIETARKTERFGNLVHAFSTYDSYHNEDDAEPFARGINSFQLLYEKGRWWVANIAWQPEWPDLPIPDTYLSDSQ